MENVWDPQKSLFHMVEFKKRKDFIFGKGPKGVEKHPFWRLKRGVDVIVCFSYHAENAPTETVGRLESHESLRSSKYLWI